jgi:pimeloyl-ACP methyl ester carboxylesterase
VVLVHGLTPEGKRDARVAGAAARLARAGRAVAVPDLPALRAQRLRPDDAGIVRDTLALLADHAAVQRAPLTVVAVSVGLGPAALALAEPPWREEVGVVLTLGGYADARELVRYFTTGAYAFGPTGGRAPVDPALGPAFLAGNLDLLPDPRDRAALADALGGQAPPPDAGPDVAAVLALLRNRDPARVDALLDALPAETRRLLDALSPARHLGRTRARLVLVHGRGDPAIPFTETLRLAAAAPDRARPVVVDLVGHVEGHAPVGRRLLDLLRLWGVCYELLAD